MTLCPSVRLSATSR